MARITKKLVPQHQGTEGVDQIEVTFLRTVRFECDGRKKGPVFKQNDSHTFDAPFAQRWLKRNAAYVTADGPPQSAQDEAEADGDAPPPRGTTMRKGEASGDLTLKDLKTSPAAS